MREAIDRDTIITLDVEVMVTKIREILKIHQYQPPRMGDGRKYTGGHIYVIQDRHNRSDTLTLWIGINGLFSVPFDSTNGYGQRHIKTSEGFEVFKASVGFSVLNE